MENKKCWFLLRLREYYWL